MVRLLVLLLVACKAKEVEQRPIDAGRPIDAPPPIDALAPIDAAAKAAPRPMKLAAGRDQTCAVLADATVRCWGTGATTPDLHAVVDLQLAGATACALLDDGSVTCWGRIAWHGKAEDTAKPAGVLGVTGVKQLFVLPGRACGRVANDSLVCWGDIDPAGHVADVHANRQPTPAVGMAHVKALTETAALRDDGTLITWGAKPLTLAGVQELGVRGRAVCGRLDDGSVPHCTDEPAIVAPPAPKKPPPPAPKKKGAKPSKPAKPAKPAKPEPPPPPKLETLPFPPARQLAFGLGFCVVTTTNKLVCGDSCTTPGKAELDRVDRAAGACVVQTTGAVRCDGKLISGVSAPKALAGSCAIVESGVVCWGDDGVAAPVAL
jgi:hypothetical protein